jgi:hypothetical protein
MATVSAAAGANLIFSSTATGGNAGGFTNGANLGGNGGAAMATNSGTYNGGQLTITSIATGGKGSTTANLNGAAFAHASAAGATGHSTATASSAGGIVNSLQAVSNAPTAGNVAAVSEASVSVSGAVTTPMMSSNLQSASYATGLPGASDVMNLLTGHPGTQSSFASGGSHTVYLGEVDLDTTSRSNATPGSSSDYTASATFSLDTTQITLGDSLDIGLVDSSITAGSGFEQLEFKITVGTTTVVDQLFTTLAQAQTYFNDDTISLGGLPSSSSLNFQFSLDLTSTGGGDGFNGQLVFGAVPEPGSLALLGGGMLLLGGRRWRVRRS